MIHLLTQSLIAFLDASGVLPADAEISLDRPAENFKPQKTTVNLFLYDIREHAALRDSVPRVTYQNGAARIERAPVRLACSYLVTTWPDAALTGEDATLKEHELLSSVLALLYDTPTLPAASLAGALADQEPAIPVQLAHSELGGNPAEFWSALGGRLRAAITLTATISLTDLRAPIRAPLVSTSKVQVTDQSTGAQHLLLTCAGTVRHAQTRAPLPGARLLLVNQGLVLHTDEQGRYRFVLAHPGTVRIQISLSGFTDGDTSVAVPGGTSTAFDINLTPNH